jgi:hypothetical protein
MNLSEFKAWFDERKTMMANDLHGRMKARAAMKTCGYAVGGAVRPIPPGPKALNSVQQAVVPKKKKRQPGPAAAAAPSFQGLGAGGYKRGGKVK